MRAEWAKLRTLPSTGWLLLLLAAGTAGLSALAAWGIPTGCLAPGSGCREDVVRYSLAGVYLGQIAVVVFATLAVTAEYGTGTIRVTLAAQPRRGLVLATRTGIVTALVIGAGAVGVFGGLAAGRLLVIGNGFTAAAGYPLSLGDEPVLRAACGTVLYLALIALLSHGVGTIVRHTAAGLSIVLTALFVVPVIAQLFSGRYALWITKYAPMNAGLRIQATERLDALSLGPWQGLGVLAAYAGVAVVGGAVLFAVRDA